ncbi:MAG: hypothetical protein LBB10_00110 [Bifidobacteriaceae bacterium]|nr:hypothetical protein [Bifidobacteriaceae bacterium]
MPLFLITILTVLFSIALASFIGFLCFRVAVALLRDPAKEALKKFKPVGIFNSKELESLQDSTINTKSTSKSPAKSTVRKRTRKIVSN